MIFLLNYMPWVIVALGIWAHRKAWKKNRKLSYYVAAITVLAVLMLAAITPSYTPKGKPVVVPVPEFEETTAEMQDNLRKPALSAEQRGEHINKRLNIVDRLNERKEKVNE